MKNPKSPAKKALVGNQANLPEDLKAKIKASPGKMGHKKSAAKMKKETPNKWILTAAKAVGKGLMGRSKGKDAKDQAAQSGINAMQQV